MSRDYVLENFKPEFHPQIDHARGLNPQQLAAITVEQARKRFEKWNRRVRIEADALMPGRLEPMRKMADTVERHLEGMLAHRQQDPTTAFLEEINSLFSATKRKAGGCGSVLPRADFAFFLSS